MFQITEETFEQFLDHIEDESEIDLQNVSFIDPCGMVGLLEIGELLNGEGTCKTLILPKSEEVIKYLERMDFFKFANDHFDLKPCKPDLPERYLRSSHSDVLLEITPIEKSDDIHFIVGKVKNRAHSILAKHLHYGDTAINGFMVALSEVCQNIVEHSGNKGFVGIQKYHFQRNLDKNVVKRLTVRSRNSTALVTPLSIAYNSGPQYEGCRKAMMRQGGRWQFAFFDREPHALFGEDVKTRNAILFHTENETVPQRGKASDIETGPLRKWTSRTRNKLFESISFTNIGTPDIAAGILKIEGPLQAAVIASLNSSRHRLQSFCIEIGKRKVTDAFNSNNQNHVFIGGTAYNFLNIFRSFSIEADSEFPLSESPVHCLEFSSESDAFVAYAILNSRIVFWLWHIQADGFHVSSRLIKNIPFDRDSLTDEQLIRLAKSGKALWEKVQVRRFSSINGGKLTYTFCPLSCNEEKDEIDSILVEASGLPTEFVLELKNFIRKIVVVDETDDKRRHLRQYFVGGVDLCAAN